MSTAKSPRKLWKSDIELFANIRRELFTCVVGDVMDKMDLQHQFLPPQIQPLRQVARTHDVVHFDEPRHRHRDRLEQRVTGRERDQQHDAERRRKRDFGAADRTADQL